MFPDIHRAHEQFPTRVVEPQASVSLAVHTTRTPRPGRHVVDVVISGKVQRLGAFDVVEQRT